MTKSKGHECTTRLESETYVIIGKVIGYTLVGCEASAEGPEVRVRIEFSSLADLWKYDEGVEHLVRYYYTRRRLNHDGIEEHPGIPYPDDSEIIGTFQYHVFCTFCRSDMWLGSRNWRDRSLCEQMSEGAINLCTSTNPY